MRVSYEIDWQFCDLLGDKQNDPGIMLEAYGTVVDWDKLNETIKELVDKKKVSKAEFKRLSEWYDYRYEAHGSPAVLVANLAIKKYFGWYKPKEKL